MSKMSELHAATQPSRELVDAVAAALADLIPDDVPLADELARVTRRRVARLAPRSPSPVVDTEVPF